MEYGYCEAHREGPHQGAELEGEAEGRHLPLMGHPVLEQLCACCPVEEHLSWLLVTDESSDFKKGSLVVRNQRVKDG